MKMLDPKCTITDNSDAIVEVSIVMNSRPEIDVGNGHVIVLRSLLLREHKGGHRGRVLTSSVVELCPISNRTTNLQQWSSVEG